MTTTHSFEWSYVRCGPWCRCQVELHYSPSITINFNGEIKNSSQCNLCWYNIAQLLDCVPWDWMSSQHNPSLISGFFCLWGALKLCTKVVFNNQHTLSKTIYCKLIVLEETIIQLLGMGCSNKSCNCFIDHITKNIHNVMLVEIKSQNARRDREIQLVLERIKWSI